MNSVAARMVFENSKKAIDQAFPRKIDPMSGMPIGPVASEVTKLTQSYLRLERALSINTSTYEFPVLVNQTQVGIFNTEQRLNQQDSFVISEIGIFLGAPTGSTDAAFILDTYPNPVTYAPLATATAMRAIYSGSFNLAVNNDILVPVWDVMRHYYAGETQATSAPGAGSPLDQKELKNDGFYPVEPNIVLIGSKKNVLKIELPAPLTAVLANSRLIIVLRGVLAQNSTPVS